MLVTAAEWGQNSSQQMHQSSRGAVMHAHMRQTAYTQTYMQSVAFQKLTAKKLADIWGINKGSWDYTQKAECGLIKHTTTDATKV